MKEGLLAFWPKISKIRAAELISAFGSIEAALAANEKELQKLDWKPEIVAHFYDWKKSAEKTSAPFLEQFNKENISTLIIGQTGYPKILATVRDAPYALFVKGDLKIHQPALAVVGSRQCTEYGQNAAKAIVPEIAASGISIVSGLATGIDSLAHELTLKSKEHTVAVLGFGISRADLNHSRSKQKLADRILDSGGAIVSEYLPGIRGNEFTFPARNRIIAGLCKGTLVIEARVGSGALITAECAHQNDREVMVIPHPIFSPTGIGVNNLLKEAAHPITTAEDILTIYGKTKKIQNILPISFSTEEKEIIAAIQTQPQDHDTLARSLKIPSFQLASLLTNLEIQGIIMVKHNQYYVT